IADATLEELARDGGSAIPQANRTGQALMEGIRDLGHRHGLPVLVTGFGAAFTVHFTPRTELRDYRDTLDNDAELLRHFLRGTLHEATQILPHGRFYAAAVRTTAEVEGTLAVIDRVFATLGTPAHRADRVAASRS